MEFVTRQIDRQSVRQTERDRLAREGERRASVQSTAFLSPKTGMEGGREEGDE